MAQHMFNSWTKDVTNGLYLGGEWEVASNSNNNKNTSNITTLLLCDTVVQHKTKEHWNRSNLDS